MVIFDFFLKQCHLAYRNQKFYLVFASLSKSLTTVPHLLDNASFIWNAKEDSCLAFFSLFEKQTRLENCLFCFIYVQLLRAVVASQEWKKRNWGKRHTTVFLVCSISNSYRNSFWHFKKSDFNVTLNWTNDLHLKFSCFCLM